MWFQLRRRSLRIDPTLNANALGVNETTPPDDDMRSSATGSDAVGRTPRHMTIEEMQKASLSLHLDGKISFFDHAMLSFDPNRLPNGWTGMTTKPDAEGRYDFVNEWESRLKIAERLGLDTETPKRMLKILNEWLTNFSTGGTEPAVSVSA